jgi:lipopolysaccharide export system protein LptA
VTWHRTARVVVAVIGLTCAAAVYWYTRESPPPRRPDVVPQDPAAKSETGRGVYIRREKGQERFELSFDALREYPDGRTHFVKGRFKDKVDGFEISADTFDTTTKPGSDTPGELSAKGQVRVLTKEGATLETDAATYDDRTGVVTIPGPLTFSQGRMTGEGLGATYDRTTNVLNVLDQTHVLVKPDESGAGAITATSQTLLFSRNDKRARFDRNVRIVRDAETLSGDTAVLFLTDDEQQLRRLELRGNAAVTPAAGAEATSPPEMHADDIALQLHADGRALSQGRLTGRASLRLTSAEGTRAIGAPRIDFSLAPDGTTLTRLTARDGVVVELPATRASPSARKITALTLDAQGNDKQGLTAARFEQRVVFTESRAGGRGQPPGERTGRSRSLVLVLKGDLDAIDQADFLEDVTFVDGDVTGWADVAVYRASAGDLQLRPSRGSPRQAKVQNGATMTVNGNAIDVNVNTQDLDARGNVRSEMVQAAAASGGRSSSLFEKDKPVFGSSAELHYEKATGQARFVGTSAELARLRQDGNTIDGVEVTIWEKTQNLRAIGQVDSRFTLTDASKGPKSTATATHRVTSYSLDYNDAGRTAVYRADKNAPEDRARLVSAEGTTSAQAIVMLLAAAGRSVERVTAEGLVDGRLEGGRRVTGEKLIYDAITEDYTLTGRPAVAVLPKSDGSGCEEHTGQLFVFNRRTGAVKSTTTISKQISCPK